MPLGTQGEMSFPTFQLEMENLRPIDLWSCVHTHNDAVRSWCHNPGFPTPYEVALHHAHTSHPQVGYYSTGWWSPPMLDDSTGLIQQPVGEGVEICYVLGTFQLRLLLLTQQIHWELWSNSTLFPYFFPFIAASPSRNINAWTVWVCSAYRTRGCKLTKYPSWDTTLSTGHTAPAPRVYLGLIKDQLQEHEGYVFFSFWFLFFLFSQGHKWSGLPHQEPQTLQF